MSRCVTDERRYNPVRAKIEPLVTTFLVVLLPKPMEITPRRFVKERRKEAHEIKILRRYTKLLGLDLGGREE